MMKSLFACAIGAVAFVSAAIADQVVWKSTGRVNDWDWSEGGNFEGGNAPTAGDVVVVPAASDVYVKDATSFALASSLKGIQVTDSASRVLFVINEGDEGMDGAEFLAPICSNVASPRNSDYKKGVIVKRGSGVLWLACQLDTSGATDDEIKIKREQNRYTYYTDLIIEEGAVKTPRDQESGGYSHYFGHVSISNSAAFFTMSSKTDYTLVRALWGTGTVTNDGGSVRHFRVNGDSMDDACEFGGVLSGWINYVAYGRVMITGTNNCHKGIFSSYYHTTKNTGEWSKSHLGDRLSVTGIKVIGNVGEASSTGPTDTIQFSENGGGFLYLGEGEVTDKGIYYAYPRQGLGYFNGGATGGVTFLKGVTMTTSASYNGWTHFVMTGSNAVPCVLAGPQVMSLSNDVSFTKQGTGTWRFADQYANMYNVDRTFGSSITVEEGTLQFDSMEEAGVRSSLGLATNLVTSYCGVRNDPAHRTEFAYIMGKAGGENATFEFTGTNGAYATRRPMGLLGKTTLRNNTTGNWRFSGVKPMGADPVTLVLDSSEDTESELAGVDDTGKGALTLEKSGAGTWTLNGSNTIHGAICVKEGTLRVNKVAGPYTWLKMTLRGRGPDPSFDGTCYITELGVYDAEGNQVNKGLKNVESGQPDSTPTLFEKYHSIARGEAAVWRNCPHYGKPAAIKNAFDGGSGHWETRPHSLTAITTGSTFKEGSPSSWFPIVMRLKDGVAAPTHYDIMFPYDVNSSGNNAKRNANSWQMEGSADGLHWDLLSEVSTNAYAYRASSWYSNTNATLMTAHKDGTAPGFPFSRTESQVPFTVLDDATVSVAEGASLVAVGGSGQTIRKLKVDAAGGMGTIDGFAFAEEGTIDVENAVRGKEMNVAATFANATDLGNVNGWSVTLGGQPSGYKVKATESGLTIIPPGLVLIIR